MNWELKQIVSAKLLENLEPLILIMLTIQQSSIKENWNFRLIFTLISLFQWNIDPRAAADYANCEPKLFLYLKMVASEIPELCSFV